MSNPVIALRQVAHEGVGLVGEALDAAGMPWRIVDMPNAPPDAFDVRSAAGLVVLGGPMNVDDVERFPFLAREVAWIQAAIAAELPVLGICLGSQLIAKALGAKVYRNGVKEIGWYPIEFHAAAVDDRMLHDCVGERTVFQWHGDTFDLPPGAVHLASSPRCRNQAFRYGQRTWALQFHLEVTEPIIAEWLREPGNCCEVESLDYIDVEKIARETPAEAPRLRELGLRTLSRFAELCR